MFYYLRKVIFFTLDKINLDIKKIKKYVPFVFHLYKIIEVCHVYKLF